MQVLAEFTPLDPVTGNRVTLRASSADDSRITALGDVRWWPAIVATPTLSITLFEGDFTSDVEPAAASISVLIDKVERTDPNARRYLWAGAYVRIFAGRPGDAWPWTLAFRGVVTGFDQEASLVRLQMEVEATPFDRKVLTASYLGTTGIEGDADLKNRVKPWISGRASNVEPVLIDVANSVFQFHGYGPIGAVNALYERGSAFGPPLGEYATYDELVAAAVPAGRWATCCAFGLIRLGAPPAGLITGDVDGDVGAGSFRRLTGEIIKRIALAAGVSADSIDSASLAALDLAVPYPVNIVITEQTTVMELARRMARPCNAQCGVSWTGQLFTTRVQIGQPVMTLDAQGRQLPRVTSSVESDVSAPYARIEMGGARNWRVHTTDEIAFAAALIDRGLFGSAITYREGNIVSKADGSRWIYIATTPAAGNSLPTLPAETNAWWRMLSGPVAVEWDAIGDASGTKPDPNATRNVFRGVHDPAFAYQRGDEVTNADNSRSYVAKSPIPAGTALANTAYWDLRLISGGGAAGEASVDVRLTNSVIAVPTDADGSGGNYAGLSCQVEVYDGTVRKDQTGTVAFALVGSPSFASVNATGLVSIGDWGATSADLKVDTTYRGVVYRTTIRLIRTLAGAAGPAVTLVGGGAFSFVDGIPTPSDQSIVFRLNRQNAAGEAVWTTDPAVQLGGDGDTRVLTLLQLGALQQVTVRATVGSVYDEDIAIRVDRSTAAAGADVTAEALEPAFVVKYGRNPQAIVDDLDVSVDTLAKQVLREGLWRGQADQILKVPDGRTLLQIVEAVGVDTADAKGYIADLREVGTDGSLKAVRTLRRLTPGGVWVEVGDVFLNNGEGASAYRIADEWGFVDPNGGSPTKPLYYIDGVLYMDNVRVRMLDVGTVKTENIVSQGVTKTVAFGIASSVAGSGSAPTSAMTTVASYTLNLTSAATVVIMNYVGMSYSADADFGTDVVIDGALARAGNAAGKGTVMSGVTPIGVVYNLAAGNHSVVQRWRGSAGVTLVESNVILLVTYR